MRILDLIANTPKGQVKLQSTLDVKDLYFLIKTYFETELFSDKNRLTSLRLQSTLNKRANKITSLNKFTFDNDLRVIEIAILIGILETLNRTGNLNKNYIFLPAWQLPKQKITIKKIFTKESWDGFIICLSKDKKENIAIPLELKSLMIEPKKQVQGDLNNQLKIRLKSFKDFFQKEGSINSVLLMPYTNKKKLIIDLKTAANDLRMSVSSKALGFLCLLTFPHLSKKRLSMSILFALVSQDPSFMSAANKDKWMCEINFGKQI